MDKPRSVLLSRPRIRAIPIEVKGKGKFAVTLRESTIADSIWLAERAEEQKENGGPGSKVHASLIIPAFINRLIDDDQKRGLMQALDAADDDALEVALLSVPETAMVPIIRAMEELNDGGGGRAPPKKRRAVKALLWIFALFTYSASLVLLPLWLGFDVSAVFR